MTLLASVAGFLRAIERAVLVLLFSLMIVLSFSQVLLRNVFSTGLLWADPLLRNAVLWLGFLGASMATADDKHIRIDLAGRYLGPRARRFVAAAVDLFAMAVCVWLADASLTFVRNEMEFHDTLVTIGEFPVPSWWTQVILPAGFLLVALRLAVQTVLLLWGRADRPHSPVGYAPPGADTAEPPGGPPGTGGDGR